MKQHWDSATIDAMLEVIDKLQADVKTLIDAGDGLDGCLPSDEDWHQAREAWERAKALVQEDSNRNHKDSRS